MEVRPEKDFFDALRKLRPDETLTGIVNGVEAEMSDPDNTRLEKYRRNHT